MRLIEDIPPINGYDIQLTIDLDQQQYAEQALETPLEDPSAAAGAPTRRSRERTSQKLVFPGLPDEVPYKAPAGVRGHQNYADGSIIAMASYPTFDNRWFEADLGDGKF